MLNTRRRWKNKAILLWFFGLVAFINNYFNVILFAGADPDYGHYETNKSFFDPLKNPARRYAATFERNNVAYIWGGEGIHSTESLRDIVPYFNMIDIDTEKHTLSYDFVNNSRDFLYFSSGAAAVLDPTNNDRALFFGGYISPRINETEDNPMYIRQYDFSNSQWDLIVPDIAQSQSSDNTTISPPRNRAYASAMAASDGNIYIAGGKMTDANGTIDSVIIWKYDPIQQTFAPAISQENTTIRGDSLKNPHGFILEDQRILYIVGVNQSVYLFDPTRNSLIEQKTSGAEDLSLETSSLSYATSFQDLSLWEWTTFKNDNLFTFSKSWGGSHIANLYNNDYILMMEGPSSTKTNHMFTINIADYNSSQLTRVPVVSDYALYDPSSSSLAPYQIFFYYVFPSLISIIILWFCWKKGVKTLVKKAYFCYMGHPRVGEPRWLEYSRFLTKLLLTFVFWAYFAYNIMMIQDSPKVMLTTQEPNSLILNPDIRLCFKGVITANVTVLCTGGTTDPDADGCWESLRLPISDRSRYYPYSTYNPLDTLYSCWLLPSKDSFDFNFGHYNGLQLSYEYILDNSSLEHVLQIDVSSPLGPNPNPSASRYLDYLIGYFHGSETSIQQLESEEYVEWSQYEVSDDQATIKNNNQYTLDLDGMEHSHLMVSFEYQTQFTMTYSAWNIIGLSPIYQRIEGIETDFQTRPGNNGSNEASNPSASITIQPTNSGHIALRERRVYSLINALGAVGGIFALIVAIQNLLYGVRPASPYGIVHRYSPKKLKISLRQALYDKFGFLERPIPLVHPVDQEFFYGNKTLMQNDHGLTVHSTSFKKGKYLKETSCDNAEDAIEMLPTAVADVQQTIRNKNNATTEPHEDTVTDNASWTISPDGSCLERELDQLKRAFAKQQEMYGLLKNDNQMMRRRQQLMEVMLKAYYLDTEALRELNKAHDISNSRHNNDNVRINMDSSEPLNTTLKSRIWTALQSPFRRRQQQQSTDGDNYNFRQTASVRYSRTSTLDDRITMTNRSSDDNDETPFARDN